MKKIIVAGGCFWGVEEYYRRLKGIVLTKTGYTDGSIENPTYEMVCNNDANHVEAVYIEYDESVITLVKILDHLFRIIDPTSPIPVTFNFGLFVYSGSGSRLGILGGTLIVVFQASFEYTDGLSASSIAVIIK